MRRQNVRIVQLNKFFSCRASTALFLIAASLCISGCANTQTVSFVHEGPVVEIRQGRIVGEQKDGISVFKGIPYAVPPVGEKRWRMPEPAEPWDGIREAAQFGPGCVQPELPVESLFYDPVGEMSEDCLTLNIWSPEEPVSAPVIVWIHGGSLTVGASHMPMYDGARFAENGTVFVSLNYRLGALGWLAHLELSEEVPEGVSGNYGLLDQIAALTWIKENISSFGGNPENVTVMGESAGALSVSYLLASPLADGLFHKAILQSPNSRNFPELRSDAYGLPSAEHIGADVFGALGAERLEQARAAEAEDVIEAAASQRFVAQGTIDGHVLPAQIIDLFDAGQVAKVPVLAGFNSGEVRAQRAFLPPVPETAQAYESAIEARYGVRAAEFLSLYPGTDISQTLLAIARDAIYGWATERIVQRQTQAGLPAYLYVFDYCYPAAQAADLCAFHAGELPFVFGALGAERISPNWPLPDGDRDQEISDALIEYWTSFAAGGVPESGSGPDWPVYGEAQSYLHIGQAFEVKTDPYSGMFELHEDLVQQRKADGDPWFLNVGIGARVPR